MIEDQELQLDDRDDLIKDEVAGDITEEEGMLLSKMREDRFKCETLFKSSSDSRKRYDWEWLTRDLFRRGYHFSRYNPSNRTVILQTRQQARIPINITHAQMRTIKNQVTSIRPKWEVYPAGLSEEAKDNARYSGKLLDYYYDHLNLRRMIKETVIQGLMYSVGGPWQIGYDPFGGEDGTGEIFVWLLDPFDFYIDPAATSLDDAQYVIKAVRTSLNQVRSNPEYTFREDRYEIRGEERLAASEYKQFLLQALKYYQPRSGETEEEGVILKEAWLKVHIDERNIDDVRDELMEDGEDVENLRLGEVVLRHIVYIDSVEDPLLYKMIRREDFPFALYQADVNPMEVYGESWIKHVIPMNRVLNALESSIFKYNYKYAVGRIVVDKNSGVRIITNEHGEIIEKNAGAEVTSLPLQALPATYDRQIQNMRMYIEDVGGAHEVSMGRIPTGVKSGIGIAELKAADAVNQQDLVDGLEEFLIGVARKILREIAQNYDVPKVVKALGKGGEPEHFTVIGEDYAYERQNTTKVKIGIDVFDLAVIGKDNEVKVQIGTWLAYTKGARLETLKEYFSAGLIDQKTFLEHAEFADVDDIIKRSRNEALLEKYRGDSAQGEQGVTDEEIAEQENFMMTVEGRTDVEPLPSDRHQIHLAVHQNALGTDGDEIIEEHMRKHEEMIMRGIQAPASPESIEPAMQPAIEQANVALQQPQQPQPPQQQQQQPQPGSPEEAALMESLMEFTGGV